MLRLALVLFAISAIAADRPPNIVIVYADDLGYADLSCFGAKSIKTPNLDRIAKEGMRFTDFYVAQAVCSASRTALLTGCYPNRVGIMGALNHKSPNGINDQEMTIAEVVKQKGYATAIVGKWHLGRDPKFLPTRHGFDQYLGLPYSNDMWPKHPNAKNDFPPLPLIDGDKVIETNPDQSQLTTRYTERATKFIADHKDKPFLLYVPHSMPHVPIFVSDKYKGKSAGGLYGDVIEELDWSVGQILAELDKHKLAENTLVIFTSDNGPWLPYGNHGGSAGPLREGKGTTWDGGVRVPCVMRWPGHIPAGSECHEPVMTIDLLPTVAKIVGAKLPEHPIDGLDIGKLMHGEKDAKSPHDALYFYWGRELQAVRSGKWKLHFPHNYTSLDGKMGGVDGRPVGTVQKQTPLALFDLETDIGETANLAEKHPEIVKKLTDLANTMREELGDSATKQQGKGLRPAGMVSAVEPKKQPNIVFLFSDDQRFDTIHALGNSEIRTPNLDRLVERGTAFTQAHIMGGTIPAVCAPSRAMLMSGRSLFRVPTDLPANVPLMPHVFHDGGYVAHGIGKWHNGGPSHARAFDSGDVVFLGGMGNHRKLGFWDFHADGKYPKADVKIGDGFDTELFTDAAIKFLKSPKDKPFFLYVAYTSPHDPRTPPPEFLKLYDPAKLALPKSFMPEHPFDNGELKIRDETLAPWPRTADIIRQQTAEYYGMISHMDDQIGRILTTLKETGLEENTIIVFAGDNGLALGRHGLLGKQNVYDHSIRVPLIIAGSNVPKNQRTDAMCYLFDLFPTLAESSGVEVPQGVEGRSLWPWIRGEKKPLRETMFFAYRDVQRAVKRDGWKLIYYPQIKRTQLFDLKNDPDEVEDLSAVAEHAERRKELEKALADQQKEYGDPLLKEK